MKLNKSKIGKNVKDIHENENNANLGERAKGTNRYQPSCRRYTADDSSEDETVMEKVKSVSDDDIDVIDTTLDEAEDSSDDDESTEEARASELLSTAKDNLRDVEMESLGDKPEGEEDRSGLGHVPTITIPSIQQPIRRP